METRKITVVSTRNQKKSIIMTAATTLADLKADLRANDIDYTDMTFYEGVSKVELLDDNSVLPHDVPYKGTITNELVIMLTNTNKKIKSGADLTRADVYAVIKAENLQEECKRRFGKNFTMCKTVELIQLMNEKSKKITKTSVIEEMEDDVECVDTRARNAIKHLLTILEEADLIEDSEKAEVEDVLNGSIDISEKSKKNESPYSDSDIAEMFNFTK